MLCEAANFQKSADLSALALKTSLDEARAVAIRAMDVNDINDDNEKVWDYGYILSRLKFKCSFQH